VAQKPITSPPERESPGTITQFFRHRNRFALQARVKKGHMTQRIMHELSYACRQAEGRKSVLQEHKLGLCRQTPRKQSLLDHRNAKDKMIDAILASQLLRRLHIVTQQAQVHLLSPSASSSDDWVLSCCNPKRRLATREKPCSKCSSSKQSRFCLYKE